MPPTASRGELRRDFPVPTPEDWRAEAERLLRGAPFDQKLRTTTPEGVVLEPLYTADAVQGLPYLDADPGETPFVRGNMHHRHSWWIAQEQPLTDATLLNASLRDELEQGLDAVVLDASRMDAMETLEGPRAAGDLDCPSPIVSVDLASVLAGIDLARVPLLLHGGARAELLRDGLRKILAAEGLESSELRGACGADPLGQAARTGSSADLEASFDDLAENIRWCAKTAPALRGVWLRADLFHEAGAHAVQELGMLLAMLTETLRELDARSMDPTLVAEHLTISVGVGGRYFTELAKLRALRLLVARVMESCGVEAASRHFHLHARCSSRNKSRLDEHVNLLRATTEAFAAAAGGANSIHVDPFDAPRTGGNEFSRRLARNLQIVLREEARLSEVVDPAGGAWYVEKLAADLCVGAWDLLREIESEGGFIASLESGTLQSRLRESREAQEKRLASRREVRVGTNQYPATTEMPAAPPAARATASSGMRSHAISVDDASASIEFDALPRYRECAPFEELRAAVESARRAGGENETTRLKVFVVTLGEVGRYMPRLDFTASAFEVGGFSLERGSGYDDVDSATAAAQQSKATILVLCGLDDRYAEHGAATARALRKACPDAALLLAGMPEEELRADLEKAGVDHFLHQRSELLSLLRDLALREGVMS